MTHAIWHIICGGVGKLLRWAKLIDGEQTVHIPVYERALVMIVFDAKGMPHEDIEKARKMIDKFRRKFYKLVAQEGEEIHYDSPDYEHD